jgi:hypothetical protein
MKHIRKILCFIISINMFLGVLPVHAYDQPINVIIDGQNISFDVPPQIINERTMVPLRAIFEALGANVNWDQSTQTITSMKNDTWVSLTINEQYMYVNGNIITLDSPACIVDGRTLVPVRAVSEAYGTIVDWNGDTNTVIITSPKKEVSNEIYQLPDPLNVLSKAIQQKGSSLNEEYWSISEYYDNAKFWISYQLEYDCVIFTYMTSDTSIALVLSNDDDPGIEFTAQYGTNKDILRGYITGSTFERATGSNLSGYEAANAMTVINTALSFFDGKIKEYGINVNLSDFGVIYPIK